MKNSIIGIRFPQNKSTKEEIVAIDLDNGKSIIRTNKQFDKDLRGSNLTLSFAEAARNTRLQMITVDALVDGEVKSDFAWHEKGSTFAATSDYANGVAEAAKHGRSAERTVIVDGKEIMKVPAVGDIVKRTVDGYVPNGFLTLATNNSFRDSINCANAFAVAKLQAYGAHVSDESTAE